MPLGLTRLDEEVRVLGLDLVGLDVGVGVGGDELVDDAAVGLALGDVDGDVRIVLTPGIGERGGEVVDVDDRDNLSNKRPTVFK